MENSETKNIPIKDCPRLKHFIEQAKSYPAIPVAVINAEESHVLQGMMEARDLGLVEPILIGKADAINITPSLSIKAEIVQNAIDLVRLLGIEQPKVAHPQRFRTYDFKTHSLCLRYFYGLVKGIFRDSSSELKKSSARYSI